MEGALHRQFPRVYRRELAAALVGRGNGPPNGRLLFFNQANVAPKQVQSERIAVDVDDILSYSPEEKTSPGVYIGAKALNPESNGYFEVEVLDIGTCGDLALGLVPWNHPLDQLPGFIAGSVGYHAGDGKVYLGHQRGSVVASKCQAGDRLGCGIRVENGQPQPSVGQWVRVNKANMLPLLPFMKLRVFFTLNGNEIASTLITPMLLRGGLFPAVALSSPGEEVKLTLSMHWNPPTLPSNISDDSLMCVDSYEDDWMRLHDIRLNGSSLEYAGRGKSILDVGLAQARKPLDTRYHYFEIEIIDPGENCYIAIGLTKKEYPHQSHPGWNKGSIAYHADDGKIFIGSGAGDPFGPRCHRGDVMGCGIIFPRDFSVSQSGQKYRKSSSDESSDCFYQCSSSDEPTEFSSQSEVEDEEYFDSDDSEGVHEEDANGWMIRPEERLLGIGRDFPVQFMQERRIRRFHRKGHERDTNGPKVEVFFTRNGVIIGQKEITIPKGGFYPTVGMLSTAEKVKVDLHPLTG